MQDRMNDRSDIAEAQCERTAREYYAFRMGGATANDLVEVPAMRRLLGSVKGRRVIDCGCGFGTHSIWCATHGASVIGIDLSETMIDLARQEAHRAGVEVDFRVGDVTDLHEIPSGMFDIAISSNAVCFAVPRFFGETARVLKPGGSFLLCEVHPLANLKHGDYFDRSVRTARNVFGKIKASDPDYEWRWEHLTLQDYFTALRDAGFSIDRLLEPEPDPTMRSANPDLHDRARHQPIFVIILAIREP